ncbi:FmdB family transcriptional regulator [Aeromicrobium sp. Leaf289]|uniref:FmdB family zinc ribbon protein n=1 Tax=Aeromicrobium sp. Leaf289 TaxID=1736324 RepID=UPI0006F50185|nr:FmdB family zinc ribbon protein [Aeromicrobium sp. Leaf289]KQP77328.1 FmdB family transcriptional regulator [Aeromicrobium sp. Leaf289]
MPTYQYQCTDCGEALEVHQSFTDDALTECPACQGRLRKVFNAVGVVFKGSGFYRNDSRGTTTSSDSSSSSSTPASKDSGGAKEKTATSSATSSSSTSSGGSAS